ncbi:hypothetical protein ACLOJK_001004 [Asimina triloba]
MAGEHTLLSAEIVDRRPDAGSVAFSVRVQRRLPDFLQSVKLKYVKLGYHYLVNHLAYLAGLPVLAAVFGAELWSLSREELWRKAWDAATYDLATLVGLCAVFLFTAVVSFLSRPRSVYLVDFACYRPPDELKVMRAGTRGLFLATEEKAHVVSSSVIEASKYRSWVEALASAGVSKEDFINLARKSGKFDEPSLEFQAKVLQSSGIGDETYVPQAIMSSANCATMKEGRAEASMVIFGALDELFQKTRIRPKDIGILVVNCSLFNPTPSLSAMVINHYKMRSNILSFNLGGMGCAAGVIALDLAKDILDSNSSSLALVVSTEAITFTWYTGRKRSMLIPNCFFRMGCSALLLSNRRRDATRAKYELEHIVRTHKGAHDRSFRSILQEEDDQRIKGLVVSRDLMEVGRQALQTNISMLAPLVLSSTLQPNVLIQLLRQIASGGTDELKSSIPTTHKLSFQHFCMQATSKAALDELQKSLGLTDAEMEASRMTLHRFGNTSSSSIWYELAYLEAKERVREGDRVWQLAFGSGLKCNSAVWKAVRRAKRPIRGPWIDCVDQYPVQQQQQQQL